MKPKPRNKMSLKDNKNMFDQDWQTSDKVDPCIFLDQLESISKSSASGHSQTMEGIYLESLIRIYLRSKTFSPFFDLGVEMRRTIKDVYEFEDLFVIKNDFKVDEFFKALNGGKFLNCFTLDYQDAKSGNFEKDDLFILEIRHCLTTLGFFPFYDGEMKKIKTIFDYWEKKKIGSNFKNIHVFFFYNREKPSKKHFPYYPLDSPTPNFNNIPINIRFYYVYCQKQQIFLNMTGRDSFSPEDMMGDLLKSKEEIEKSKEETAKSKEETAKSKEETEELKKKIQKQILFEYM